MMILAVNIVGNSATDRDISRGGSDRQKPSAWHNQFNNIGQQHPRFAAQEALLGIELDKPVQ